ncbi:hypothetical protein [Streptomyces phaeoluteigriseus]
MGAGLLSDLVYQAAWRGDHTTAAHTLNCPSVYVVLLFAPGSEELR